MAVCNNDLVCECFRLGVESIIFGISFPNVVEDVLCIEERATFDDRQLPFRLDVQDDITRHPRVPIGV